MINDETVEKIVEAIYLDVTDRRGIKQEFFKCDKEVVEEIKKAWFNIIKEGLNCDNDINPIHLMLEGRRKGELK